MGIEYGKGLQENNIGACVKHFAVLTCINMKKMEKI